MSFGSIAPLLVLVFAGVMAAGVAVRVARAVRAGTTQADDIQRARSSAMTAHAREARR